VQWPLFIPNLDTCKNVYLVDFLSSPSNVFSDRVNIVTCVSVIIDAGLNC
jgi:hypothetical protein